jgi:hypothetical protein
MSKSIASSGPNKPAKTAEADNREPGAGQRRHRDRACPAAGSVQPVRLLGPGYQLRPGVPLLTTFNGRTVNEQAVDSGSTAFFVAGASTVAPKRQLAPKFLQPEA